MGLIQLLFRDPAAFLILSVPLLYSIIIHELAHGWVAFRMGDMTAKWMGRLTLNPLRHLDPIGTLMLFIFGFGWAKPVPVNIGNMRNQRLGLVLTSAAGITANFIVAFLSILLLRLLQPDPGGTVGTVLQVMAYINIILAAFNLIPIPPLDGSKIVMGFLPSRIQELMARLEPFGFFIIIGLLYLGWLNPVIAFFKSVILGLIGLLLP
ncbi:MAG: site-2 protease family protein [Syntrophales bacterium]|jgi:Zn-dependent protease|nr:site-2 protease family protein [Syntrophales bacterium]